MKLKIVFVDGKSNFSLVDDDTGDVIGEIFASNPPKVEDMTKFQNSKVVVDGKSLKRLQRSNG